MQPPIPPRSRDRLAGLRLPELPPRDLERLEAGPGPHSAPTPSTNNGSAPDSASYLPPPGTTPTKFGCEGSPADVRGYAPAGTSLLVRGGVVSPGMGGGPGLVLPTLSLPLTNAPLPPASQLPGVPLSGMGNMGTTTFPGVNGGTVGVAAAASVHPGATSSPSMHAPLAPRRGIPSCSPPSPGRTASGARTLPSSPVNGGLTQNEIKKAQNRKSAKRFREAQKQRWKNMADDLMSHKRTIDELRAQLAAQANTVAHANNALRAASLRGAGGVDNKRSAMSIHDLVDADALVGSSGPSTSASPSCSASPTSYVDAEAALYAQILSNRSTASKGDGECREPYVKDLGVLTRCLVVEQSSARIVSMRRGSETIGNYVSDGLVQEEMHEFQNALTCGKPVAITFHRDGSLVNAVMNPVDGTDRVVVAEFAPL